MVLAPWPYYSRPLRDDFPFFVGILKQILVWEVSSVAFWGDGLAKLI